MEEFLYDRDRDPKKKVPPVVKGNVVYVPEKKKNYRVTRVVPTGDDQIDPKWDVYGEPA